MKGECRLGKKATIVNFKKAQGLLSKIITMVEEDAYCIDIIQQILAVIGLLRAAQSKLLANHLDTCFRAALQTNNRRRQKKMIKEILQVIELSKR